MEKEIICAFSSDSRNLYKADIYRALSMPDDYLLHFRYKYKYVDEKIKENKNLIGKKINIFYTITKDNKPVEYISIREATIYHIEKSDYTELFNVYMKLGKFIDAEINNETENIFLGYKTLNKKVNVSWKNRVDKVNDYFEDELIYYFIKNITSKEGEVIEINNDEKNSYYALQQGSEYLINLAVGNPKLKIGSDFDNNLDINTNNADIVINSILPIELSAQFDDIQIPFFVKHSDYPKVSSHIIFQPNIKDKKVKEFVSYIKIEKKNSKGKSIYFGLLSLIALIGLFLLKDNSKSFTIFDFNLPINYALISGAVLIVLSTSILHYNYNKK